MCSLQSACAQVFFIRDGIKFPDMVHALKPNPKNHIQENWRIADFFSHIPESMHMVRCLPSFSTTWYHYSVCMASPHGGERSRCVCGKRAVHGTGVKAVPVPRIAGGFKMSISLGKAETIQERWANQKSLDWRE